MSFFTGTPGYFSQQSTLGKEQLPLYDQLRAASQRPGAGGAFGEAADYYRDLLSDNSSTYNQMAAPEFRRFREQIVPELSNQFAGMHGYYGASGHQRANQNAAVDLSERLAALRAQLRQQGASGLMNIGQQGLSNFHQNFYHQREPGFLEQIGPAVGSALTAYGTGGLGTLAASLGAINKNKQDLSSIYKQGWAS